MNKVKENGFEIYLVGGFVRDSVMQKRADDADFTTNATPEEMLEIFKDFQELLYSLDTSERILDPSHCFTFYRCFLFHTCLRNFDC